MCFHLDDEGMFPTSWSFESSPSGNVAAPIGERLLEQSNPTRCRSSPARSLPDSRLRRRTRRLALPADPRPTPPAPTLAAARKVGKAAGRHPHLRAVLDARLDPAAATGLALTLALVFAIGGGVLLGLLAYLVRTNSHLIGIDNSVAKWGNRHASAMSTHLLNGVTQLGSIYAVIVLCVVLAVAETIRERSVWVVAFIVAVMGGEEILIATVKQLVDRVRPTFNPAAATLGPSFPSGHSATAAAFYATAALLLGRWRARPSGEQCWRVSRSGSPSRSPRAACCSTCTG